MGISAAGDDQAHPSGWASEAGRIVNAAGSPPAKPAGGLRRGRRRRLRQNTRRERRAEYRLRGKDCERPDGAEGPAQGSENEEGGTADGRVCHWLCQCFGPRWRSIVLRIGRAPGQTDRRCGISTRLAKHWQSPAAHFGNAPSPGPSPGGRGDRSANPNPLPAERGTGSPHPGPLPEGEGDFPPSPALGDRPAAVHRQTHAGDVVVLDQKNYRLGHVLRTARPLQERAGDRALHLGVGRSSGSITGPGRMQFTRTARFARPARPPAGESAWESPPC